MEGLSIFIRTGTVFIHINVGLLSLMRSYINHPIVMEHRFVVVRTPRKLSDGGWGRRLDLGCVPHFKTVICLLEMEIK